MGILDTLFGQSTKIDVFQSRLHEKISKNVPESDEEATLLIACLSGLLARVAYCDMNLDENEEQNIRSSLQKWCELEPKQIDTISSIAIEEIKELAGLENHKYCYPLIEITTQNQRYKILEALFCVAAADGSVEQKESNEIRDIANSLKLEHKYYVSARATVLEYLKVLKSD